MKNPLLLLLLLIGVGFAFGQSDVTYQTPSKEILDLVDAPLPPTVSMNTEGTKAVQLYRRA